MKRLLICIFCLSLLVMTIMPANSLAQEQYKPTPKYSNQIPSPTSAEDRLMHKLARGIMQKKRFPFPLIGEIPDSFSHEITRCQTYRLSKFDNESIGKAIALELAKKTILDELMDQIKVKADRPWGYYRRLPKCKDVKVLLPSIISIEQTGEEWADGTLKLMAKTTYVLRQIIPAIVETCNNPDMLREIKNEHRMGINALNEILGIQREVTESVKVSILNQRYREAVSRLITANQLQRARYFALWQDTQQAIDAYSQAIEKSPKLTVAYRNRGALYITIGDKSSAIKDIERAAQLGDKRAQDYLSSKGIEWHIN